MPISVDWDNADKRIIREHYTGTIDFDELDRVFTHVTGMFDSVDHPVDIVMIIDQSRMPDNTLARLPRVARHPEYWNHPNLGRLVVVGANSFVRTLIKMYTRVYPTQGYRFLVASTETEAYQIIRNAS